MKLSFSCDLAGCIIARCSFHCLYTCIYFPPPCSFPTIYGSYLDLPRLTFNGKVRVDPATGSNNPCNFHPDEPVDKGWNFHGTGEFSLLDCRVTSALGSNGVQPLYDAVINSAIISNINGSYPMAVDLDVQLMITTVYGLTLAVIGADGGILVQGAVKPFVLGQDRWIRSFGNSDSKCQSGARCKSGANSASVISEITWGNISESPIMQELKDSSNQHGGKLSISITIYSYTSRSHYASNDTLGYVIGTIGSQQLNEPVLVSGERILSYEGVPQYNVCHKEPTHSMPKHMYTLMYKAPFQINHHWLRLSVDFSNSISFDSHGNFRDLGLLWIGVQDQRMCVHLIGEPIPYLENDWVCKGCIYDHILSEDIFNHLLSSPLYVYRAINNTDEIMCHKAIPSCLHTGLSFQPMLKEIPQFIRPMNDYLGRLEYRQSMTVELKVTQYGWPIKNQKVHIIETKPAAPQRGIVPFPQIVSQMNKELLLSRSRSLRKYHKCETFQTCKHDATDLCCP